MKKSCILLFLILVSLRAYPQAVNYSPKYFGPNALPVPAFTDATIPANTTARLSGDYYFGFGDNTRNFLFTVEVPLLPKFVSLKVWTTLLEHYTTTSAVLQQRNATDLRTKGSASGDIYVQTRMLLLKEKPHAPSIILNSTLKTASGTEFDVRRYYDTPGYYFDVEIGKSVIFNSNSILSEIRAVVNAGFLCWETTNSMQNDAPMYGAKVILRAKNWEIENALAGYWGWMRNGDNPLVYTAQITHKAKTINSFAQYQYGINDYPYHHLQLGIFVSIAKLTPDYE